ncbi:hypothetical protein L1987_16037 [Smallanthus sonchifolius]|uniref:Uncharacterized protein n=1 Tax=Smallanthus sonchifolius TaxID=185202 RepID=A0ACB9J7R3_9ASTR|nr:hypothetical protein L1987_16037 [Smallanthus sonchifolius]
MAKNGTSCPWNGNERNGAGFDLRIGHFCWHWLYQSDQNQSYVFNMLSSIHVSLPRINNNTFDQWSSVFDNVYEIKWEDLIIRECVRRGTIMLLYHAFVGYSFGVFNKTSKIRTAIENGLGTEAKRLGTAAKGLGTDAKGVFLFKEMRLKGVLPNEATIECVLPAYTITTDLQQGLHGILVVELESELTTQPRTLLEEEKNIWVEFASVHIWVDEITRVCFELSIPSWGGIPLTQYRFYKPVVQFLALLG